MLLREIVQTKGSEVHAIRPTASCDDVITELVRCNIGSLLVRDGPDSPILGIITERDILRAHATHRAALGQLCVDAVMSTELITADADDHITVAMRLMTTHRIRHLLITYHDELFGIVSIGDIVKTHHDQLEMENYFMRSYIQGEGAEVGTPET